MDIGNAVLALQHGDRVARAGWNDKNMFLFFVEGDSATCQYRVGDSIVEGPELPYIMMRTAQGPFVPWLCSQTDLLATDWGIAS